VHQCRHGERPVAGGGRTAAVGQLGGHLGGDAAGRLRDRDGTVFAPQTGWIMTTMGNSLRSTLILIIALGSGTSLAAAADPPLDASPSTAAPSTAAPSTAAPSTAAPSSPPAAAPPPPATEFTVVDRSHFDLAR